MTDTATVEVSADWYYELEGARLGPVSDSVIEGLIAENKLDRKSVVWRKGQPDWSALESTPFASLFADTPPPLTGAAVNNTLIWWLAAAPIVGLFIEGFLSGLTRIAQSKFWWVTLVLNIVLSTMDEKNLQKAGHDTKRMGAAWIVPVYLYKRAEVLKQKNTYFIVWVVLFVISLLADV